MDRQTTIETIGWTLFGVTLTAGFVAIAVAAILTGAAGHTERFIACVEAGLTWVQGACI